MTSRFSGAWSEGHGAGGVTAGPGADHARFADPPQAGPSPHPLRSSAAHAAPPPPRAGRARRQPLLPARHRQHEHGEGVGRHVQGTTVMRTRGDWL